MITVCPECQTKLSIKKGEKEGVIKLFCPNINCSGISLRKLQKGIAILDIKGLGPKTIEKLSLSGIESVLDLFDSNKFKENKLCESIEFKKGRALDNILESVSKVKEIEIHKFINSLQIMVPKNEGDGYISIGKSLSEQIGRMISGVPYDFDGLSRQVREEIMIPDTYYYVEIMEAIKNIENFGVEIKKFVVNKKPTKIKKVSKLVNFDGESNIDISSDEIIQKLDWGISEIDSGECNLLIVVDKNNQSDKIKLAQSQGIKIMTYKQIKILFL